VVPRGAKPAVFNAINRVLRRSQVAEVPIVDGTVPDTRGKKGDVLRQHINEHVVGQGTAGKCTWLAIHFYSVETEMNEGTQAGECTARNALCGMSWQRSDPRHKATEVNATTAKRSGLPGGCEGGHSLRSELAHVPELDVEGYE
jgi:hypothetical protein